MASLTSILILGPDTVAAARPATPIQLVHACRRWGFNSVIPASWGDELIAEHVIQRCASRENRPVIQCACPRVAERLAPHAPLLEDAILWMDSPPVAVARYLRALDPRADIHLTYAGSCAGALDSSIDQQVTPTELLLAIAAKGIDLAAQPTVFEDLIPADRRRHLSAAGGLPDPQRLWEAAAFRIAQPVGSDLAVGIAQLLLGEDRFLIDMAPAVDCVCRLAGSAADDSSTLLRAPTPVVTPGMIDVARSVPARVSRRDVAFGTGPPIEEESPAVVETSTEAALPRHSPGRPAYRRQSVWRRQSPRPGMVIARPSGAAVAVADVSFLRRPAGRFVITALIIAASLIIGLWIGRQTAPATIGSVGATEPASAPLARLTLQQAT